MVATLIFVVSFLTLLQFFVSYSRSLIAESRGFELSEHTRVLSGITALTVHGDHFERLLQLIALCPEPGEDRRRVLAVSTYFNLLGLLRLLFSRVIPAAARWVEAERRGCAYVAAVVLDRRIANNRMMLAQQSDSRY